MSFHNPGAWLLIALAIPIAVFYVWNLASHRHEIATFPLWQQALARRPTWLALRSRLSLAAQLLILLLLVAALAQPYWTEIFTSRRNVVLVLDVSASMSATDVQPSRFEAMRKEAERIVGELNRGEQLAVISAGSLVRIAHRFPGEPETLLPAVQSVELLAAIQSLEPTDGTTQIVEAVEMAWRMLEGKTNPGIIVLTDGAFTGAGEMAGAEDVQIKLFGDSSTNVAITRLEARPDPHESDQFQVFVEAANYSEQDVDCPLEIISEGGEKKTVALSMPAGESVQDVLSYTVNGTGLLLAKLQKNDGVASDNAASVLVQIRKRPVVTLVAGDPSELDPGLKAIKAALEANPHVDVQAAEEPVPDTVSVLCKQTPDELPDGPLLVVEPEGSCDLWGEGGVIDDASAAVKSMTTASPLLAGVDFAGAVVEKAVRLDFKADMPVETVVESASGDPLYSAIDRPEGRIAVLHVKLDTDASDLTRRPDFSTLVDNAVRWLNPAPKAYQASTTTDEVVALAPSESPRKLTTNEDGPGPEIAAGQSLTLLDHVGVWKDPGGASADSPHILACNLASASESDLRVREGAQSDVLETVEPTSDQPLWMLLIGIAILLISVEWCLFHRRVVV